MNEIQDIEAHEPDPAVGGPGVPRWLKWALLGALALIVVGYAAIFLYAKVLNDSPETFGKSDLDARLAGDETTTDLTADAITRVAEPTRPAGSTTPDSAATGAADSTIATSPATAAGPAGDAAGTWSATAESEVGYRVKEILFGVDTEGVGRTNDVTGSLTIDGTKVSAAEFVVDVASIASDEARRDSQFRGRIMSTDEFPTATFTLTEPIELGVGSADGTTVDAVATGELTLRGVTNAVTFDVSAKQEDGRIGVLGNIPVVFADYEIANPSVGGITTEDNGQLEFVLVFEPA